MTNGMANYIKEINWWLMRLKGQTFQCGAVLDPESSAHTYREKISSGDTSLKLDPAGHGQSQPTE